MSDGETQQGLTYENQYIHHNYQPATAVFYTRE